MKVIRSEPPEPIFHAGKGNVALVEDFSAFPFRCCCSKTKDRFLYCGLLIRSVMKAPGSTVEDTNDYGDMKRFWSHHVQTPMTHPSLPEGDKHCNTPKGVDLVLLSLISLPSTGRWSSPDLRP